MAARKSATKNFTERRLRETAPAERKREGRQPAEQTAAQHNTQQPKKTATRRAHNQESQRSTPVAATTSHAGVAQPAERPPCKRQASGSIPDPSSKVFSARQRAFIVEYLRDKNATQAAIRAGYSAATARQLGHRLLTYVHIRAEVERLEAEQLAKVQAETGITLERTLREIARGAFHDPRRFFTTNGELVPITDLDDDTAAALAGFEVTELGGRGEDAPIRFVSKIKLGDRKGYLDMLMKHLGGYKQDNEQREQPMADALREFFTNVVGAASLPITRSTPRERKPPPPVGPLVKE